MHASRTSHLLGPTRFVGPSRWEVREVGGQWRGEPLRQIQWSLWRQRVCSSSWHPVSCVCEKMLWERSETKVVTALRLRKRGNRKDLFACLVCHLSAPDNSERLLQSKTSSLVKWTKLISADFPRILRILLHFNLGGFSLYVSFSKRAVQIYGGFMNPLHRHYLKKILRIWILRRVREIDRFFLRANLIVRPALHMYNKFSKRAS